MNISHRIKLGETNIRQMRGSGYNTTATTHTRERVCVCVLSASGDQGGTFTNRKVNRKEMSLFFFSTEIRNFIR